MEEESENAAKLTQWATTETEVGDDGNRSLRETQNLSPKCEVEQEFENVGKLIGSASTEAEVGGDGDRS